MKRSELEHLIRAAATIAEEQEIVVIGSQAILGQFPAASGILARSAEADVFPLNRPEKSDIIDGAIGEGSRFHEEYGYYAQGVDDHTAVLPRGWRDRLIRVENMNMQGKIGLCLEVHDLAISKYIAGRPKDLEFTAELARHAMTNATILSRRLSQTQHAALTSQLRTIVKARIRYDFGSRDTKVER
jgi:hypothetical protein